MRRRRRVMLAAGALAAVAAHCVAVAEPADRRLITFDETHNALTDTVTEVANEAVNAASNIVSAVLGGGTRTDSNDATTGSPSASISVTIGGDSTSDEDEAAEKSTTTDSGGEESTDKSFNDDDTTPTAIAGSETTPSGVSVAVSVSGSDKEETTAAPTITRPTTTRPTTSRHSGVSHAVSMTKRPRTTTPTSDSTGNESTDNSYTDSATPTAAPARTTQAPASEAPVSTEAPVVSVPTPTPITIVLTTPTPPATEAPAAAPVTTDTPVVVAVPTDIPAAADTPVPTTESSSVSGFNPDTDIIDDSTDAPASAGSTSTDALIIIPDESTVVPLATTRTPAVDTGNSVDPASDTPSAGPATWTDSSGSSNNNDTVTVSSASGEGTSEGMRPGQVHASSSADVSLDGSDTLDVEGSHSSHGPKQKKNKTKKESHSSSGDCSAGSGRSSSTDTAKSSASNSGSSGDGRSGLGGFLNPGGVSDVNTSSATYYSLGTGSIVAIVGVIAGIMGLLVLFVAISRKKYTDDDGESPLPYGYNMDIRSVARLSPTFMQDDSFMESGYNGTALMVAVAPPTYDGASSTSGESADEVPSLRGHRIVTNQCDPLADISLRSRVPSMPSFSGDLDTGNVRVSALYSAGSSVTSGSAISGSWSSVLASDTERQPSRNTRDTTLSAWSAANLSSFGSTASGASGASGMYRMTRSSSAFSALSGDLRHTGGSDRSRSSSRLARQPEAPRVAAGPVDSNRSNKSTEI